MNGLSTLSAARPRRTLILFFAFVVFAGVVGGPVAGRLDAGGGFTAGSSESNRAAEQLRRATGESTSPGFMLLVEGRSGDVDRRAQDVAATLAGIPGVSRARRPDAPPTEVARSSRASSVPAPVKRKSPRKRWAPSRTNAR